MDLTLRLGEWLGAVATGISRGAEVKRA